MLAWFRLFHKLVERAGRVIIQRIQLSPWALKLLGLAAQFICQVADSLPLHEVASDCYHPWILARK